MQISKKKKKQKAHPNTELIGWNTSSQTDFSNRYSYSDTNLLPGIKLGIHIKDECSIESIALYQTIKLIEEPVPIEGNHRKLMVKINKFDRIFIYINILNLLKKVQQCKYNNSTKIILFIRTGNMLYGKRQRITSYWYYWSIYFEHNNNSAKSTEIISNSSNRILSHIIPTHKKINL